MESKKLNRQASRTSVCSESSDNTDIDKLDLPDDYKNMKDEFDNNNMDYLADDQSESDDWTITEQLEEGMRLFEMFTCNKYIEGFEQLEKHANVSMVHAIGVALCRMIKAMVTLRPEAFPEAWIAINHALNKINRKRKRRSAAGSLVNSLMLRNNYEDYTDENCHAELLYAETQAAQAALTVLSDMSVTGFVKGAIRIRACFNTYKECQRIHKHRKNWDTETSRKHFVSGIHLGLGLFEIAISFFPSKMITLLEMAGFSGDRTSGMNELLKGADVQDGIRYPAVAIALSGYYGFGEFFYGIGEPNVPCIYRILEYFLERTPESVAVTFGCAFREQTLGNFDAACQYYTDFTHGQRIMKSFHYISNWQKIWIYAAQWKWAEASENARFMVEKCSWSPSMFMYNLAVCLATQADNETDQERKMALKAEAMDCLVKVVKLKRNFGGRRAFHEKLVTENAKKFMKHPNKMVLPALDVVYLWNGFRVASYSAPCLPKMLEELDSKLKTFTKEEDLEIYCYLTFMKGCAHAYSGCNNLAMDTFLEVLTYHKEMTTMKHLAPQASFEIGLIYRRMGDFDQSRAWLKRARKYSDYITDVMIGYRINYVLGLIKNEEKN
ncbi:Tetratricopeptide repeat protein 39B [Halotydeus destructor]|nr:Tetratricopeptide repeat protein 39B [Halotydeus destructor]